jgi:hypothetical protein
MTAITIGLLEPAVDRGNTWLELTSKLFDATPGTSQRNNLFPEVRRVRVPRFRHRDTLLSEIKCVHQTGGTPAYEKSIGFGAAPPRAYRALGQVYARSGETEKARRALEAYLVEEPEPSDRAMIEAEIKQLQ